MSSISPYELYLKLYLSGPDNSIKIAICSKSANCNPIYSQVRLKKIHLRVTDSFLFDPVDFTEIELEDDMNAKLSVNRGVFESSSTIQTKTESILICSNHLMK